MAHADHADHYDHYSDDMIERLDGFFGSVDEHMNAQIAGALTGCTGTVLDFGCGFGNLVEHLRRRGFDAVGIDMLDFCVEAGRKRSPEADLRVGEGLSAFADRSLDAIVLKDAIHHLADESDVDEFLSEVSRVCRGRLVVYDPNPTITLRLARWLIGHVDPVLSPADCHALLSRHGFQVRKVAYSQIWALPLSGGYVGRPMVPQVQLLERAVMGIDKLTSGVLNFLGLGRFFCWRYLLVAEVPQRTSARAAA